MFGRNNLFVKLILDCIASMRFMPEFFFAFGELSRSSIITTDGEYGQKSALIFFVEVDVVEENKALHTNPFLSEIVRVSITVLID